MTLARGRVAENCRLFPGCTWAGSTVLGGCRRPAAAGCRCTLGRDPEPTLEHVRQAATEWAAGAGVLPPAGRAAAADALMLQGLNHTDAVGRWGRGDDAGAVLRGGLHAALAAGGSFRAGVRLCIRAGGESCSRCAGLGGTVPCMQGRSLEGCAMQASEPALSHMSSWPISSLQEYYNIVSLLIKKRGCFPSALRSVQGACDRRGAGSRSR